MKICPQCNKKKTNLLKAKGICVNCNSSNWYRDNRDHVLQRTRKYGWEKTRKKRNLPLDHPRLIGEFGKGHLTPDGYRYINKIGHPNAINTGNSRARIYEHTYVMSMYLGRPLKKNESVHHKNGIRDDNRIENLELWHKGQPMGQRLEDKINWAIDFLTEYGYAVKK